MPAATAEEGLVSRWPLSLVIAVTVRTLSLCDTTGTRTYVQHCPLWGFFSYFPSGSVGGIGPEETQWGPGARCHSFGWGGQNVAILTAA